MRTARDVPVVEEVDVLVHGGTRVSAAVAAARAGAQVAMVERHGCFGGAATAGLVSIWHWLMDTTGDRQIIGGLTAEVMDRLRQRGAVVEHGHGLALNTEEMETGLDRRVVGAGVRFICSN